jgi:DNA-binding transcriptional MerR regulator
MNNSFSQMALNFGAETEQSQPNPLSTEPPKAEIGGYVVGMENGYAGIRVRIKSLKNVQPGIIREETPEAAKEAPPLRSITPVPVKQESAKVIELKLFDLPPIEISGKEESPVLPAGEVSAEEEFVPVKVPDNLPVSPASIATGTSSPDTAIPAEAKDNILPITEAKELTLTDDKAPAITVSAPPAITVSKAVPPPIPPSTEDGIPDTLSVNSANIATGTRSPDKPAKSKRGRKSLKQATAEADLIEVPGDDILFSKQYYTMRAVAEMFRVNQSLLRFWETEFDILQPRKNKKGDRYFRPIDIKNLHLIYHLLRQRKYTIEGAKEFLKNNKKAEERFEAIQKLQEIRAFLLEWKAQL